MSCARRLHVQGGRSGWGLPVKVTSGPKQGSCYVAAKLVGVVGFNCLKGTLWPVQHIAARCSPESHIGARCGTLGHGAAQNGTLGHVRPGVAHWGTVQP